MCTHIHTYIEINSSIDFLLYVSNIEYRSDYKTRKIGVSGIHTYGLPVSFNIPRIPEKNQYLYLSHT